MDDQTRRAELRQFLQSRRARLRPEDLGLPAGGRRRVPGLRREEVAALAGVGVTWYTMFETGAADGVSDEVVEAVARALRFSPAEREHLAALAKGTARPTGDTRVDPLALRALHEWVDAPAYVITSTWDILAWNDAFAFVWAIEPPGSPPFNAVLRAFVDPVAREMHGENWPQFAATLVAMYRTSYAKHIGDGRYEAILSALREYPEFVAMWDRLDVAQPTRTSRGEIESPAVGRFAYEALNLLLTSSDQHAFVAQVPDEPSAARLRAALERRHLR